MSKVCVQVAVRVRPLLPREVLHNHRVCVSVVPDNPRVLVGTNRTFDFDSVFGPTASLDEVYEACVQPLVRFLVEGRNATVLAYGQTGSGKTHTLGSGHVAFLPDEECGIIGRVAQDVFSLLGEKKQSSGCVEPTVGVSYMELYREELRDLLELHINPKEMHIREDDRGNTVVVGAKETVVSSAEELLSILEAGNALRHTGTTAMNERSSRSHAILTLHLTQRCHDVSSGTSSLSSSKLHLVDLAGSERAGKTGNTGTRLKESVHINTGLLALGNVIRVLSDQGRSHRGNSSATTHVPYRDAKLTRLLRDSLGGAAHTLMVACVSPSHHSMAETLSVLQFAHRARHIRNRPRAMSSCAAAKSCPAAWDPGAARVEELEGEVRMLKEVLREKEREVEREKAEKGVGRQEDAGAKRPNGADSPSEPEGTAPSQRDASQYLLLAHEAAALMEDMSTPAPSGSLGQRLRDWQERFNAVTHSNPNDGKGSLGIDGDEPHHHHHHHHHLTILQLRRELNKCQEALVMDKQELEQKNEALRGLQQETQEILKESRTHLRALEEERERTRIQTEQLVDQQILIKRLRSVHATSGLTTSTTSAEAETAGSSSRRPHSVPLIDQYCGQRPERKIHSSPPAHSLERVIASFKMRGHLLLAEIEEKDEVYRPSGGEPEEREERREEEREDPDDDDDDDDDDEQDGHDEGQAGFRRSLNRTWTNRQKWLQSQKQTSSGPNQEDEVKSKSQIQFPQSQPTKGSRESRGTQPDLRKSGASAVQRRIQELSVSIRMKEELLKELDKTGKHAQAVDRRRGGGTLARLSLQSQQARAELLQSLQHMVLQRARLQSGLLQESHTELEQNKECETDDTTFHQSQPCEDCKEEGGGWLGAEEQQAMRRRAALRELEEEKRRRKETLQRRDACLQQRSSLESKRLRSSQVLSQDLLRVSVRLASLEELLEGGGRAERPGGVSPDELEEERDALRHRRNALEAQLQDGTKLTAQEEQSLLQMEEALEALDAALEFKNQSIRDKQQQLTRDSSSCQSDSTKPAELCDVTSKLRKLSLAESTDLLVMYFNKVVRLREEERRLRLCCEELRLRGEEQEKTVRKMEAALQRVVLDADQRLTQQHRENQTTIQLLLQHLEEGSAGEPEQAVHARMQQLEKDLFFYKSSSRQLKKKLKELLSGSPEPTQQLAAPPSHPENNSPRHHVQLNTKANDCHATDTPTRGDPTWMKMHTRQTNNQILGEEHGPRPSSPFNLRTHRKARTSAKDRAHAQTQGRNGSGDGHAVEGTEVKTIRLSRRGLREVSPADLRFSRSAARGRHSAAKASTESLSMLEDSLEMSRKQ